MLESSCEEILGTSAHVARLRQFVRKATACVRPVLISGEPGVGKELVARKIHAKSRRHKHPFLMIDCSLYYERELRREVFGYRGLGGSAKARKGIFEFASRGTCYLSRIEELSSAFQESLVSFLRTGRYRRLGDGREIRSRVRVIASSTKNLESFVAGGLFSSELFERFSDMSLSIPSLRERPEDIRAAVAALEAAQRVEHSTGPYVTFSPDALDALGCFPWPGNFEELINEVGRALECGSQTITPEHLSFEIASYWMGQGGDPDVRRVVEELESYIQEFRILSRLDAEFGDILLNPTDLLDDNQRSYRGLRGETY